jgi:hypothetical protein
MTLLVSDNPIDVAMADIDGDGNLDLVAALVDNTMMPLVAWLGDGDGNLGAAIPSAGQGATLGIGLQLADLDDDGNLDAIHGGFSEIFVAWGQGDGGFEQPSTIPCMYFAVSAVGHFDDDNLLDVACTTSDPDLPPISDVLFALNLGGRNFSDTTTLLPSTFQQPDLVAADMDADGDDELLTYDLSGSIRLFRQTAPATFMLEDYSAPAISGKSIAIGDLDGDERPDVVLSLPLDNQDPTRIVPLLQTPGGMLVGQATVVAGMQPSGLVLTDVSSDGFLDVVVALESGSVALLAGDGAGGLVAPVSFLSGLSPWQVATGNLDGDGVP